jgi:hypothetical protein
MSQRPSLRLAVLGLLVALLTACTPADSQPGDFAIYLIQSGSTASGSDLSRLELESTPFLSVDDLISYTWATHEIEFTEAARQRLAQLEVPVTTGVPFVVCVGTRRIYSGAFWVSYSSISFDGFVIDTLPAQAGIPILRIQLGYPTAPELFSGADLRADPRILQSLQTAGRLR